MQNLLLVLTVPDDYADEAPEDPTADGYANDLVDIVNWVRKLRWQVGHHEGERPPFEKIMINLIPSPQFLDGNGLKRLVDAARAANDPQLTTKQAELVLQCINLALVHFAGANLDTGDWPVERVRELNDLRLMFVEATRG